ncbi:hypothetical protein, partial [Agrobacterium rosae]|uniref:hypothetical protein n=1 Tax=Agrobacterium rosae TaxID=1972867 RepID=UPI0013565FC1
RTMEGLEARIEDLLGAKPARPASDTHAIRSENDRAGFETATARPSLKPRFDPVNEIRQRQQALDARWRISLTGSKRGLREGLAVAVSNPARSFSDRIA